MREFAHCWRLLSSAVRVATKGVICEHCGGNLRRGCSKCCVFLQLLLPFFFFLAGYQTLDRFCLKHQLISSGGLGICYAIVWGRLPQVFHLLLGRGPLLPLRTKVPSKGKNQLYPGKM